MNIMNFIPFFDVFHSYNSIYFNSTNSLLFYQLQPISIYQYDTIMVDMKDVTVFQFFWNAMMWNG